MTAPDQEFTEPCEICIVGTGAAGGLLAYRLAMAGNQVVSIEQGGPIDDTYFTNDLPIESMPHFGMFPEIKWPMPPSEGYLYGNQQAFQLYATPDLAATAQESDWRFVNRQIYRLNGKLNTWNAVALRMAPRDFRGRDSGDSETNWALGYDDLKDHYTAVERLIGVCGTSEQLDTILPDGEFIPPLELRPIDRFVMKSVGKMHPAMLRAIPIRKAIETRPDRAHACRACGECIFGCRYGSIYKFSSHLLPRIERLSNYRIRYLTKVARLFCDPVTQRVNGIECIETQTGRRYRIAARTVILAAGALETPRILFNSRSESYPNGLANSSGLVGCYLQDKVRALVAAPLFRFFGNRTPSSAGCGDHLLIPRFLFDNEQFRGGFQAQVCHVLPRRPYYLDGLMPFPPRFRTWLAKRLFRTFLALLLLGKPEARRSNRVLPATSRDRYGVPQVAVEYAFSEQDLRMRRAMVRHGKKILHACSGYFGNVFANDMPGASIHYAGTCRLAANAADGVVDTHLRAFNHPNLYICDGSVMPEVAEKNLTLTVMALAERLAAHLIDRSSTS